MTSFEYLQITIFAIGILTIIIAGLQDKKNRLAPAIYATPALIGFAINPQLGIIGGTIAILLILIYKEEWNKKIGLADTLLFLTLLLALFNPITLAFTILLSTCFLIDLILIQKPNTNLPLIWIFSKWLLIIIGLLALIITFMHFKVV
ncbi:MAG: hypothetical protein WCI04_02485 [archaeon]